METEPETAEAAAVPATLAGRLADGDPDAPRELVERHHAEIYRYALAMLRDPTAAEDAAQASFERAFGALGRYPEGRIRSLALRAWLYRIALNVVRNMVRDERREVAVAEVPEEPSAQSRTASGPKGHAEAWLDAGPALCGDCRGHGLAGEHGQDARAEGRGAPARPDAGERSKKERTLR
jgi:RNA polymerase sigma factor (sigma-70 family)